jgi:tetratricopeptide (TPR) repeat protein
VNNQLQEIKKAIEQERNNIKAYADWRDTIARLENPEKELKEYEKAIGENLKTAEAYNDFGILLYTLKKYNEAISEKLESVLKGKGLDASILSKVKELKDQMFYSPEHFYSEFEERFGDKLTSEIKKYDLLRGSGKIKFKGFEQFEPGYYVLLTFAAFIFMVTGLFLQKITKLKFGAMELEKSTVDQITTSTPLGILK